MEFTTNDSYNPWNWQFGGKGHDRQPELAARPSLPLGPYSGMFDEWVPRMVNPHLYEAIREAVGPIDGAINRIVTLDGILNVEGNNTRLVEEIEDWMASVNVNEKQTGMQAFYASQGNEMYEQGCSEGEFVLDPTGSDVIQLNVADSKGIYYQRTAEGVLETWYSPQREKASRRDGTDQIERVLRNTYRNENTAGMLREAGYKKLNKDNLVYAGFNVDAGNPYGTSIIRSTEFDARVLLVIKNSLYRVWERFGDPTFHVNYKTKKSKDTTELEKRRKSFATMLSDALAIKKSGNSADMVTAVGKDDEISISIIGGDGQVLEVEMPARHVLENIVSKSGLPAWILGFHWSTAERLAQRQADLALQESRTRFTLRKPGLEHIIATMLRARGHTWKKGDWKLTQELPNLQDILAQAQAGFLEAQTELMHSGASQRAPEDNEPKHAIISQSGAVIMPTDVNYPQQIIVGKQLHGHKVEAYVEDEPALMRLERTATRALQNGWDDLYDATLDVLSIESVAKAPDDVFIFNTDHITALRNLQDEFINSLSAEDAEFTKSRFDAWVRGISNGADELGSDEVIESVRSAMADTLQSEGLELVRTTAVRAYGDDVLIALADGIYDGSNPRDVARGLRKRFEAHTADWDRLARSEISDAQGRGKIAQYEAHDLEQYNWVRAGGACSICVGLENGGPYAVGDGPLPMTGSHPCCRCTITAVVPE